MDLTLITSRTQMHHHPRKGTKRTMSYYSVLDGLLFKSYLPGHLKKRSTFRDQLVIPETLVGLIMHAYHDHVLSGGHIAFRPTYDKTRQKNWWPTISRDVRDWCEQYQACQQRKTANNNNAPDRPTTCRATFQRKITVNFQVQSVSTSAAGIE